MLLRSLLLPLFPLAALPFTGSATATTDPDDGMLPPPGMVHVPGGRTLVGSKPKDIEALVIENESLRSNVSSFIGETPQKRVPVKDFYLMVSEVTNEQYAAYVEVSGARPPYHWAEDALDTARKAFLEEQAQRRQQAVAAGEQPQPMKKFEAAEWWAQNWRGQPWGVPSGLEAHPVVFVDYGDAEGYARWAGLRLMTEEEYQRACRGDDDRTYPWGEKWEDGKYAATQEIGNRSDVMPSGSFPDGANEQGVVDLAGNAWEWTASKYVPYDGYKSFKITIGRGKNKVVLDNPPNFNPDQRVVVSGSIQNPRFMARCTTRGGFERFQQASALGFRCAASLQPGIDMSATIQRDVPVELRPRNQEGALSYDSRLTLALDRWQTAGDTKGQLEGYEVISGYDYAMFVPIEKVFAVKLKDLRKASVEHGLVPVGLFATNQQLLEPAIEPGVYAVSFRGKGEPVPPPEEEEKGKKKKKKGKKDEEPEQEPEPEPEEEEEQAEPLLEELIAMDPTIDNFVLFDMSGAPVAAIGIEKLQEASPQKGAIVEFEKTITKIVGEQEVEEIQQWLGFDFYLIGRQSSKGFLTRFPLRFADGVLDGDWRRSQ